ncbi:MAG TPA: FtsX-like permease family protein [Polyangia bacterium]|nr:FtsX-like permease family protein [Polyangia bacterium]
MSSLDTVRVSAQIAVRNLGAHRLKTFIVGGIIFFGAFLVVLGNSLVDSIDSAMSRSVIGSVAGNIQVYDKRSKDELAVMGGMTMGDQDLTQIDDFAKLRDSLLKVPHVKSVVPMGISGALVTSGNTIDIALERLRGIVRKQLELGAKATPEERQTLATQLAAQKDHVRQIITVLQGDMKNIKALATEAAVNKEDVEVIEKSASDAFWAGFDKDPYAALEYLENHLAPLAVDADLLFIRYVGTDLGSFSKSFDRMKIVDGTTVPPGRRGFLFSKFIYEDQLKLKAARRLDKIKEAKELRGETIAKSEELQRFVRENTTQVREVLLQLDALKTAEFRAKLQKELGLPADPKEELGGLLAKFFATDDANFQERYDFFYRELAPALELYRVRIGDVLTIKAFTKSGYVQSVNIPVYGTFQFEGLEKSTLAGGLNLMDLVSFRELYGFMSSDKLAEIQALRASAHVKEVSRENAEAELFGEGSGGDDAAAAPTAAATTGKKEPPRHIVADATPGVKAELPDLASPLTAKLRREEARGRVFPPDEVERGVVLNAAVILDDPKAMRATIPAIEAQGKKDGLELKAISWQQSAGLIGNFIWLARIILSVAILIIFTVALVIINNSLVMATLERVREIGTLRAIGAQRTFILTMLVVEAIVIGLIFGGLGALAGGALVKVIAAVGIPAKSDVQFFFFSGPRLRPFLNAFNVVLAFFIVLVVSTASSLYPAWLAMRVTPRQAMQEEE